MTAARDAIALTNITLGERLARAAVSRGGGLDASELLARSLLWQGKAAESEETLSLFNPDTMNELELVRWGTARIANLQWSMGDAEGADEVLKLLRSKVTHPRVAGRVGALGSVACQAGGVCLQPEFGAQPVGCGGVESEQLAAGNFGRNSSRR